MTPIISIITPSYNKADYISETINSVISQRFRDWELIIVDDGSTDETINIINAFSLKDERIHCIFNSQNVGANRCRNIGIEAAKGKYVILLDADDVLLPHCFEERFSILSRLERECDFCVFTMGVFQKQIGDNPYVWEPKSKTPLEDFLSHKLPWQTMQPIWNREFLLRIKGFDENFKRLQDVELHTRALMMPNVKFELFNSKPDCYYRIDNDRKNFNPYNFYNRWVESAVQYYLKFYPKTKTSNQEQFLAGTIFKTYLQILHAYKIREITKAELTSLKEKLFVIEVSKTLNFFKRALFRFVGFYNLSMLRIPGINWMIKKWLIL